MAALVPELRQLIGSPRWRGLLASPPLDRNGFVEWRPDVLSPTRARRLVAFLDRELGPHLRPVSAPLPDPRRGRHGNYAETLPKVVRNHSALLNNSRSAATHAARRCGLLALMRSTSLRELASHLAGVPLGAEMGRQVIRYGNGDYVGPHHDAHPDHWNLRGGYVDFHLSVSTSAVQTQQLVHQDSHPGDDQGDQHGDHPHLCRSVDVGAVRSGVTVSRLPFWHYTTPLTAVPGQEARARRWLLLVSFELAGVRWKP